MVLEGSEKKYLHLDGKGSVLAASNAANAVSNKFTADAWGNGADEATSPYRFTARRVDAETGNYYYRNRYYSARQGRFMSQDPIGYGDGLNMYAYVKNDPVNYRDPMGLDGDDAPTEEITVTEERRSKPALSTKELSDLFGAGASDVYNGHESASQRRKRLEDEERENGSKICGHPEFTVALGIDGDLVASENGEDGFTYGATIGVVLGVDTRTFISRALSPSALLPGGLSSALAVSVRQIGVFNSVRREQMGVDISAGLVVSINPTGSVSDFDGESLVLEGGGTVLSGGVDVLPDGNNSRFVYNGELSVTPPLLPFSATGGIETTNVASVRTIDSCKTGT